MGLSLSKRWRASARTTFAALMLLASARMAGAQPAPTPEEVQQAQVRWNEGKKYFDAGNYEAARVAFKQAYTVFPHAAFLQNLGEAELRAGRNVEAARHFTAFLRASAGSPAQRELAKKSLARASERLGSVVVSANVDDAEIRIDDEVVGRSPLGNWPFYVEPGAHVVTARKEGYLEGSERVDVVTGPPRAVLVRVKRLVSGQAEPLPEEPKPAPALVPPVPKTESDPAPKTSPPAADARSTGVSARTVVLLSGAALAVAGAAVGTVFAIRAEGDLTRIRNKQDQMNGWDTRIQKHPPSFCVTFRADFEDFCDALDDDYVKQHNDQRVRDIAFVSAGVFGVATLATVFLWRPRSSTMSLVPSLNPAAPGLAVTGAF